MSLKSLENIYLVCPLSLGDYFVCNAIVLDIARKAHSVHIPAPPQFLATLRCLYSDVPNVTLLPYLGQDNENSYVTTHNLSVINFRTVFENITIPIAGSAEPVSVPVNWDRQIYEYFDMPFSKRYREFHLPKIIPNSTNLMDRLNPENEPYVMWHKHTSKHVGGMPIDLESWRPSAGLPDKKIIEVELGHTPNLLDYVDLIKGADEIHCVPSSFFCLVDSMSNQLSATLFYHDYRRDTINQINSRWNGGKWHRVEYGVKL